MIGYVTLGTDDLDRSRGFYDALFAELGASRLMELDSGFTLYGISWGVPGVAVTRPYNKEPATAGNGNMVSLVMDSRDKVDRLYAKAIELGGTDEGAPGVRGEEGDRAFYGAYFRDLDGHKFCVFRIGPA
ncbi:MAG TPA: VOC family protein [Allosphingosinicella sp.]|jgi:catechol 2,3-dioxygenase-like lactoylglutathione lyase family enzyme